MTGENNDLMIRAWEEARDRVDFQARIGAVRVMAEDSPAAKAVLIKMDALLGDFGIELLRSFVDELATDLNGDQGDCSAAAGGCQLGLDEERARA
ncbi:MAG TPA: hypothetical protein VM537_08090 [Anaerolineae bacterium]|nr:hypothetical protein [Anaerolineae bacterium]